MGTPERPQILPAGSIWVFVVLFCEFFQKQSPDKLRRLVGKLYLGGLGNERFLLFSVFRGNPEPHVAAEHQAGLGFKAGERAECYDGKREEGPLEEHPERGAPGLARRPRREDPP